MHKVREAMKSSGNNLIDVIVHVDEFIAGGHEESKQGRSYDSKKKKSVCAVELTNNGKVKRFYTLKIKDFSVKLLNGIFDKHTSKEAKITTDNWKGYRPISKDYDIIQIPSK